jgi:hypothetical protein
MVAPPFTEVSTGKAGTRVLRSFSEGEGLGADHRGKLQ